MTFLRRQLPEENLVFIRIDAVPMNEALCRTTVTQMTFSEKNQMESVEIIVA